MANESETNIFYNWIVYPVNMIFGVAAFTVGVIALLCLLGAGIIGLAAAYIGGVALKTVINTSTALISFPFNALNVLLSHVDAFFTKKLNKIDNTFLKYTLSAIISILDVVIFIPVKALANTMNTISRYLCLPDIASIGYQFSTMLNHKYFYSNLLNKGKKESSELSRKELLSAIDKFSNREETHWYDFFIISVYSLVKWDIYCFDYIHNLFSPLAYKDACNDLLVEKKSKFDKAAEKIINQFIFKQSEIHLNDDDLDAIFGEQPDIAERDLPRDTEFSYLRENPDRHEIKLTSLVASVSKKLNQIEYFLTQVINRSFLIAQQCLDLLLFPIKKFNTHVLGGLSIVFLSILQYIAPSSPLDGLKSLFFIPVVAPLMFLILCALPLVAIAGFDELELLVMVRGNKKVEKNVRAFRWLSYGLVSLLLWPIEYVTMVVFKVVFQLIRLPIELIASFFSALTPLSLSADDVNRAKELMHEDFELMISDECMRSSGLTENPLNHPNADNERQLSVLRMHIENIQEEAQKSNHRKKVTQLTDQIERLKEVGIQPYYPRVDDDIANSMGPASAPMSRGADSVDNDQRGQDPDLNPSLHGDSSQVQGGGNGFFGKQPQAGTTGKPDTWRAIDDKGAIAREKDYKPHGKTY